MAHSQPEALAPHRVIAERVRELRKRHGWSAERLAQEMTKVGVPWERMIVTKLETGRRRSVSVEELLALAYVLSVAPIHLIVPTLSQDELGDVLYAIAPGVTERARWVRAWIRGEWPSRETDARVYFSEVPTDEFAAPSLEGEPGRAWGVRTSGESDDAGR